MRIEQAAAGDLAAIMSIERARFDPAEQWSEAAWSDELVGADRLVLVARDAAAVIGVATFQVVADGADLHRVAVTSAAEGTGVARQLLEAGLDEACRRGATRMLLEVDETNGSARGLYLRHGFSVVSRRTNYYGPGRTALVLQRDLTREGVR